MPIYDNIPDLSTLRKKSLKLAVNHIFQDKGPKDYYDYALVANFARLVDLATSEYESGRSNIGNFWNSHETLALGSAIRASSHFEVCIDALTRAIKLLQIIIERPQIGFIIDNPTNDLINDINRQARAMRNTIHHLDERIVRGQIQVGQPIFIAVEEKGIELGHHIILYTDLALWIRKLNDYADQMIQ